MSEVLEILEIGAGASLQDEERAGWKRFGLPAAGAMDAESARLANGLVNNAPNCAVVELLFGRARFRALRRVCLALTGAEAATRHSLWRSFWLEAGEELTLGLPRRGLWNYLAVAGGVVGPRYFGSASRHRRADLGLELTAGLRLAAGVAETASAIAGRFVAEAARPTMGEAPPLRFWPGPEWGRFSADQQALFLQSTWTVSQQSDRMGYRLDGPSLAEGYREILSGPTTVGTIQVPANGQPIVLMRDGPTVGGYPRLGVIDEASVSIFSQCAPGQAIRFARADGY